MRADGQVAKGRQSRDRCVATERITDKVFNEDTIRHRTHTDPPNVMHAGRRLMGSREASICSCNLSTGCSVRSKLDFVLFTKPTVDVYVRSGASS